MAHTPTPQHVVAFQTLCGGGSSQNHAVIHDHSGHEQAVWRSTPYSPSSVRELEQTETVSKYKEGAATVIDDRIMDSLKRVTHAAMAMLFMLRRGRGDENTVKNRLKKAAEEMAHKKQYHLS